LEWLDGKGAPVWPQMWQWGELRCGKLWMSGGLTLRLPAVYLPDSAEVVRGARGRTVRTKSSAAVDTVRVEKGRETAHEGLEWD